MITALALRNVTLGATLCLLSFSSLASVVVTGTRIIYPSDAKEISVKLDNKGKFPVLIQSWIDDGNVDAPPEKIQVPFVLTPPINRVEPSKGQTLRVSYTGGTQPTDKESVFWLNVLEIPAKHKDVNESQIQVAFRSRFKIFFRPVGLEGNANEAIKSIQWSSVGKNIKAVNPTPYFVSLVELKVNGKKVEGEMIAPKSSLNINLLGSTGSKISGSYVNDYGAVNDFEAILK
ncbi:TPA: fimbria/pilus periplasmic chaperone [Klebsiella pneumoniae]|uniref:fimbria/pilus periplasmic chaperone n=1 Tax=Klebsiella pneumoniae TaxID=573 RepID=UPI000907CFA9|nr:fimbria/pilus periplasmic chaperone [Klebsiella pneumoniae]AUN53791.1 pilus assembly protein PapD [Klebsiella pneumoniae]EIV5841191.1 fimbria/pilus periplasmic chaperone [Klebsiella pneumoniae]EIV5853607.1 fimbria/pilus periplasmic chaperone [Klebsiella pneumoniae]EIW8697702.1 molecular chaperone [Klebsiella pneumoniae]EIX9515750.1 fimbria/pilus periplasmic chaperone [Klebsiella pneumoniae]